MRKEDSGSSRRTFLNWFLGTSVGALLLAIAYPLARFVSPPEVPESTASQVEAGPTNDPAFIDKGFKIIRFGADPVIVLRVSPTDFRAFSATCTHLECIVEYQRQKHRIFCNCHNGVYDLHGRNVAGPPPRPLKPYKVHLAKAGSGQPEMVVVSEA